MWDFGGLERARVRKTEGESERHFLALLDVGIEGFGVWETLNAALGRFHRTSPPKPLRDARSGQTPNLKPLTLNPTPQTLNPRPQTPNPKPYTLNSTL